MKVNITLSELTKLKIFGFIGMLISIIIISVKELRDNFFENIYLLPLGFIMSSIVLVFGLVANRKRIKQINISMTFLFIIIIFFMIIITRMVIFGVGIEKIYALQSYFVFFGFMASIVMINFIFKNKS